MWIAGKDNILGDAPSRNPKDRDLVKYLPVLAGPIKRIVRAMFEAPIELEEELAEMHRFLGALEAPDADGETAKGRAGTSEAPASSSAEGLPQRIVGEGDKPEAAAKSDMVGTIPPDPLSGSGPEEKGLKGVKGKRTSSLPETVDPAAQASTEEESRVTPSKSNRLEGASGGLEDAGHRQSIGKETISQHSPSRDQRQDCEVEQSRGQKNRPGGEDDTPARSRDWPHEDGLPHQDASDKGSVIHTVSSSSGPSDLSPFGGSLLNEDCGGNGEFVVRSIVPTSLDGTYPRHPLCCLLAYDDAKSSATSRMGRPKKVLGADGADLWLPADSKVVPVRIVQVRDSNQAESVVVEYATPIQCRDGGVRKRIYYRIRSSTTPIGSEEHKKGAAAHTWCRCRWQRR